MAPWENNIYYLSFLETSKQKVNQVGVIIKPIRCNCMYSKKELQALDRGHRLVEWGVSEIPALGYCDGRRIIFGCIAS